jgi:hypothetical protein
MNIASILTRYNRYGRGVMSTCKVTMTHTCATPSQYKVASPSHLYKRFSTNINDNDMNSPERDYTHFKISAHKHPLDGGAKKLKWVEKMAAEAAEEMKAADHTGRQQNHIWSKEELEEAMSTLYRHQPKTWSDHVMNKLVSIHSNIC